MAPKNLPAAMKQAKTLEYFRSTMDVYTFKELEKSLPSVASINQMQVKDHLQALQDENLIRVEKIGSGNWYWCFQSDAKKNRQRIIDNLHSEQSKLADSLAEVEDEIKSEMAKREHSEVMSKGSRLDIRTLAETHEVILKEAEVLDKELACYCDLDPAELDSKVREIKRLQESALLWTDNIETMESFLSNLINDRTSLAGLMQAACGDEYVIGEGLKDI